MNEIRSMCMAARAIGDLCGSSSWQRLIAAKSQASIPVVEEPDGFSD